MEIMPAILYILFTINLAALVYSKEGLIVKTKVEALSKIGFLFKVKAGKSFNPQEYCSILRT